MSFVRLIITSEGVVENYRLSIMCDKEGLSHKETGDGETGGDG